MGKTWLSSNYLFKEPTREKIKYIFRYNEPFPKESCKLFDFDQTQKLPKVVTSLISVKSTKIAVKMLKFEKAYQNDSAIVIPLSCGYWLLYVLKNTQPNIDALEEISNYCYVPIVFCSKFSVEKKGVYCKKKKYNHKSEKFVQSSIEAPKKVMIMDSYSKIIYESSDFKYEHPSEV